MSEEESTPSEPTVDSPESDTSPPSGEERPEPEPREIKPDAGLLHRITAAEEPPEDVTELTED